jgi:hypothetical protein
MESQPTPRTDEIPKREAQEHRRPACVAPPWPYRAGERGTGSTARARERATTTPRVLQLQLFHCNGPQARPQAQRA